MSDLSQLASLLKSRNTVDSKIAAIIGCPTHVQDVGAHIASAIFGIILEESASHDGSDGKFSRGPLAGRSVALQWYTKREGSLSLKTDTSIDYYLVLAGPKNVPPSNFNPWVIESVFLFNAKQLLMALRERNVQIGTRTSVINALWDRAEIYPNQTNRTLVLSSEQRASLALFQT